VHRLQTIVAMQWDGVYKPQHEEPVKHCQNLVARHAIDNWYVGHRRACTSHRFQYLHLQSLRIAEHPCSSLTLCPRLGLPARVAETQTRQAEFQSLRRPLHQPQRRPQAVRLTMQLAKSHQFPPQSGILSLELHILHTELLDCGPYHLKLDSCGGGRRPFSLPT
jgi:hypothetical protein